MTLGIFGFRRDVIHTFTPFSGPLAFIVTPALVASTILSFIALASLGLSAHAACGNLCADSDIPYQKLCHSLFQYPKYFFTRGGCFLLIPFYILSFVLGNRELYRRPSGLCLAYGNHREPWCLVRASRRISYKHPRPRLLLSSLNLSQIPVRHAHF